MSKNKTSIEFIETELQNLNILIDSSIYVSLVRIFEQAKAIHQQEIIESYCTGCLHMEKNDTIFPRETSEQYYNETYGKE